MKSSIILLLLTAICTIGIAQDINHQTDSIKVYNSTELDKRPSFIGGEKGLNKFVRRNTRYPIEAEREKAGGLVIIRLIIAPDGNVSNPEIIKLTGETIVVTLRKDLNEEAIRVVMLTSGHWVPGALHGQNKNCYYYLPIRFTPPRLGKKSNNN